jgi:hypothetical protein
MTTTEPRRASVLTRAQLALVSGLVLLLIAAVVAAALVIPPAARASAPDIPVKAYLQALVDGDATKALALAGIHPGTSDELLTDAAYRRATDRISAFRVTATEAAGGAGRLVVARITQGAAQYSAGFLVEQDGKGFGLGLWHLAPQSLPTVRIAVDGPSGLSVTAAGVALDAGASGADERVLPGTYTAALAADPLFTAPAVSVTAYLAPGAAPRQATLQVGLTEAATARIEAAVDAWLDGCAASTELAPPACPFRAVPTPGVTYSDGRWDIRSRPALARPSWSPQDGGWRVAASSPGYASFSAQAMRGGLHGTASTGVNPFGVSGTAIRSGDGFRFQPSAAYADAGSAGPLA